MISPAIFFRSTSLAEDINEPSRFAHYRPTARALPILKAVTEAAAATMVIAPYGSGKSLAAGVAGLALRNEPEDRAVLSHLRPSLAKLDASFSVWMENRSRSDARGKLVVLTGAIGDPLQAIADELGMTRAPKSVEGFTKAMRQGGWDHVAIVWDEFGRHLESLVAEGQSRELDLLQRLAERTARASGPTMSLTLLLHQNLLSYATKVNETTRTEWRKIEGRFRPLRLVEDSSEFYGLIAEAITSLRPSANDVASLDGLADAVIEARWLDGLDDGEEIIRILGMAQPFTPGALQVLPTLVARVGQNERSLFSFLREADLSRRVGLEEVYCAFEDAMRTDVGIGGTYRRWVETESARSRAGSPLKRELLAAACLLQLGSSGERRRLSRSTLELAIADGVRPNSEISQAVDELIDARLLIWRAHHDDVAVWHGADINVALRVSEERERRGGEFDLKSFLEARFPAPHLRTPGHNARFGVNRYFAGLFALPSELAEVACSPEKAGLVVYVLAQNTSDIKFARSISYALAEERIIVVVPQRPVDVESAALELVAIEALRADDAFMASDPMVAAEIDELQSVALEQLARLLRGLLDPQGGTASWIAQGERLEVSPERPATLVASRLLDEWFQSTPIIANEQLMRTQVSRTMQTARVRVISGILERGDRPRLGYEAGDRSAEGSIYRTVLEKTGLRIGDEARFADVAEIGDPGLARVWRRIAAFFEKPTGEGSRPLTELVDELTGPPAGVPAGVLPILIAAGFRKFARVVALYRDGVYVPDLLGFQFDNMVANSEAYRVRVLEATPQLTHHLTEICLVFSHERPAPDAELVRAAHDAVAGWLRLVPDAARRSNRLEPVARKLLRAVSTGSDPVELLIHAVPDALGCALDSPFLVERMSNGRIAIDGLRDAYADEAVLVMASCLAMSEDVSNPLKAIKEWAGCFDADLLERRTDLRIVDRSVLRKASEAAVGRFSEKSLANALSSILLQCSLDTWDDRTGDQFRAALREARQRIEAAALDTETPSARLRPILQAKIDEYRRMLIALDQADEVAVGVAAFGGKR